MEAKSDTKDFPIVCVGGSAGGLDAYTRLLRHLPTDMGARFFDCRNSNITLWRRDHRTIRLDHLQQKARLSGSQRRDIGGRVRRLLLRFLFALLQSPPGEFKNSHWSGSQRAFRDSRPPEQGVQSLFDSPCGSFPRGGRFKASKLGVPFSRRSSSRSWWHDHNKGGCR